MAAEKKTEEKTQEKDLENDNNNVETIDGINFCDVYGVFNAMQFQWSNIFIDIRSQKEYENTCLYDSHNIPFTSNIDNKVKSIIDKIRNDKGNFIQKVYFISNNKMLQVAPNNKKSSKTIEKCVSEQFINEFKTFYVNNYHINIPFYSLNCDFLKFCDRFPYLCFPNDKCNKNMSDVRWSKYPNHILNDKLFLGSGGHAKNEEILVNLGITHVINVTLMDFSWLIGIKGIKYLHIPIADDDRANISKYFVESTDFINNAFKSDNNNRVFVHCQAGVSRSSTIIIAYLMKMKNMTFDEAFKYVQERREIIEPNDGFIKQLKEYQKKL